jgi:hypothetical protein
MENVVVGWEQVTCQLIAPGLVCRSTADHTSAHVSSG